MRNAELTGKGRSLGRATRLEARTDHSAFRTPHSAFLSFAQRQEVGEEPIGTRDTSGELSKEAQPGVHVRALAERGLEQPALKRRLARIVHLDERRVGGIPIVREIQTALLHPASPIVRPDFVRDVEYAARR